MSWLYFYYTVYCVTYVRNKTQCVAGTKLKLITFLELYIPESFIPHLPITIIPSIVDGGGIMFSGCPSMRPAETLIIVIFQDQMDESL